MRVGLAFQSVVWNETDYQSKDNFSSYRDIIDSELIVFLGIWGSLGQLPMVFSSYWRSTFTEHVLWPTSVAPNLHAFVVLHPPVLLSKYVLYK